MCCCSKFKGPTCAWCGVAAICEHAVEWELLLVNPVQVPQGSDKALLLQPWLAVCCLSSSQGQRLLQVRIVLV